MRVAARAPRHTALFPLPDLVAIGAERSRRRDATRPAGEHGDEGGCFISLFLVDVGRKEGWLDGLSDEDRGDGSFFEGEAALVSAKTCHMFGGGFVRLLGKPHHFTKVAMHDEVYTVEASSER